MLSVAMEVEKNEEKESEYGKHERLAVGIDIGEKESVATYMSPSGDIIEHFTFEMKDSGYNEFC